MRLYLAVISVLACSLGLMACTKKSKEQNNEISAEQLYEANFQCIDIESQNIIMHSDKEGKAKIKVKLPDYEILYKDACKSKNPDEYLLNMLESGEYNVREYEIGAEVTVENGKEVIHTDEAIKKLLTEEFSNVINTLMEVD